MYRFKLYISSIRAQVPNFFMHGLLGYHSFPYKAKNSYTNTNSCPSDTIFLLENYAIAINMFVATCQLAIHQFSSFGKKYIGQYNIICYVKIN